MSKFSFSNSLPFQLLSRDEVEIIHLSSLKILEEIGVQFMNEKALNLLRDAGAEVDSEKKIAYIPQNLVKESIVKAPSSLKLYSRDGKHDVLLEGNRVAFLPGATSLYVSDRRTGEVRPALTADFVEFVRLVDSLRYIHSLSSALVPQDVPIIARDWYRLYLLLRGTTKTIFTGVFRPAHVEIMKHMLETIAGGEKELARKPIAAFATDPSSPLRWSDDVLGMILKYARYRMPILFFDMSQLSCISPATIAGTLAQINAEFLSALVLTQSIQPGTPIIYGAEPTLFNQRTAAISHGAIETLMIGLGYTQMAKYYGIPSCFYAGASDTKLVDAQTGFESGIGLFLGALAGVNWIAGAGYLIGNIQSFEKLVIDNEICRMALRLLKGIEVSNDTLSFEIIKKVGHGKNYLTEKHTLEWLRKEAYAPPFEDLIDRLTLEGWRRRGSENILQRARRDVDRRLKEHISEPLPSDIEKDLDAVAKDAMKQAGIESLPAGPNGNQ